MIDFTEFQQVFGSLVTESTWGIMISRDFHRVKAIRSLHKTTTFTDTGKRLTAPVATNEGVRQGCCVCPSFAIYVNYAFSKLKHNFDSGILLLPQ